MKLDSNLQPLDYCTSDQPTFPCTWVDYPLIVRLLMFCSCGAVVTHHKQQSDSLLNEHEHYAWYKH